MRIDSSQLSLASTHQLTQIDLEARQQTVRLQQTPQESQPKRDTVSLSGCAQLCTGDSGEVDDPRLMLLKMLVAMMTGRKFSAAAQKNAAAGVRAAQVHLPVMKAPQQPVQVVQAPPVQVAVSTQSIRVHAEAERTTFAASGTVTTADGRTIDFSAALEMTRGSVELAASSGAAATDPLVLNLNGGAAQVAGPKFDFDLNADGQTERMSFTSGGGYLALDRNGDGKINDGTELFGASTGNGYAELAAYDSDQNGWIDEADAVFTQLKLWTAAGLSSLADAGVGAISTASVGTEFSLKQGSELEGQIRRTGVYLSENGAVGTTQQVDLVA